MSLTTPRLNPRRSHLITLVTLVTRDSVMLNWEMEFKKWCPAFKLLTYYGTAKERKAKRQGWSKPHAFHVCITSYTLALQDAKVWRRVPAFVCVCVHALLLGARVRARACVATLDEPHSVTRHTVNLPSLAKHHTITRITRITTVTTVTRVTRTPHRCSAARSGSTSSSTRRT
jgi:hypothetical protein